MGVRVTIANQYLTLHSLCALRVHKTDNKSCALNAQAVKDKVEGDYNALQVSAVTRAWTVPQSSSSRC